MAGIAIIGAGRIGRIHAANLYRNPEAELIYICDVSTDAAAALADTCGARVGTVQEVLSDRKVDAVVIASPTDTHAEMIGAAAQEGKSIFCEKPLDLDVGTARQSLEAVARADVLLCVGFNRRHDPSFAELRRQIGDGRIGDVEVVSITSRDPSPPPIDYIRRSGGLFRDMMIHDFDMARWLLGEEPVEVYAAGSSLVDADIGKAGDVDTAVAVLRTAEGRMCQITNSRRCSYGYDQRIEVFGSEGLLRADNQTNTSVSVAGVSGTLTEPALPFFLERYADAYRLQLDKFLRAVNGDDPGLPDGTDGLRALQLAEAAQASCEQGRPVTVAA